MTDLIKTSHNPKAKDSIFAPDASEHSELVARTEIDASCRVPVMVFFASAIFWLLVGTALALLASVKMHWPEFPWWPQYFVDADWLTFGRVRPAHLNTVIYGWATAAGVGTMIWLMARLCQAKLIGTPILMTAAVFWNLGVLIGTLGILGGHSTSIEWLEFPAYITPLLFVSYALISIWAVIMFTRRPPGHVYVSQWYLLGAIFWFPWLYGIVQLLMLIFPVQGSIQGIVNWWFAHNVLGLWFTPIGLAAAYYFIPKVIGKPVYSYYLSALGFWSLALFYSWNGGHHLIGGPLPTWVVTASIVASCMMIIPVLVVALNHHLTMRGKWHLLLSSPTLRFIVFGAMMYTAVSLQGVSMSLRSLNEVTHFTHYTIGHAHWGMYAFFTMVMFGSMYYIVPRLVECEWRSANLIKWHFWCTFYGILLMLLMLTVGGLWQGFKLADAQIPFEEVVESTLPWLMGRSFSGVLIAIGHLVFAYHFFLMIMRLGKPAGKPTLLNEPIEPVMAEGGAK